MIVLSYYLYMDKQGKNNKRILLDYDINLKFISL